MISCLACGAPCDNLLPCRHVQTSSVAGGGLQWELLTSRMPLAGLILSPDGSLREVRTEPPVNRVVPPGEVDSVVEDHMRMLVVWGVLRS